MLIKGMYFNYSKLMPPKFFASRELVNVAMFGFLMLIILSKLFKKVAKTTIDNIIVIIPPGIVLNCPE